MQKFYRINIHYQEIWLINKMLLVVDNQILLLALYSLSAAWVKDLSIDTCFRSVASFCDSHYLSKTPPHSIHFAQNSQILDIRKTLLH